MSRRPGVCRYCKESLELACPPGIRAHDVQHEHAKYCPRAPWRIQPGWQAVALVHTPWWRRLLGR